MLKREANNRTVQSSPLDNKKKKKRDRQKGVEASAAGIDTMKSAKKKSKVRKNKSESKEKPEGDLKISDDRLVEETQVDTARNGEVSVMQSKVDVGMEIRTGEPKKLKKKKRKEHDLSKEGGNIEEDKSKKRSRKEYDASKEVRNIDGKKSKKKNVKELKTLKEVGRIEEKKEEADLDDVYYMSSGDEDCSKGMKKWLTEYYQSRPGLNMLHQRIDDFLKAHDEKREQEKKEREALAAEGGWTVVTHHKGRKKTTESETGTTVGSVAQAVVEDQLTRKKPKELGNFYRFQKREARRNEILMLQSKFEQDKKRIQQLRAARKFRPY